MRSGMIVLILLLALSGCSSSGNNNVMPEMSHNAVKKVEQYKTCQAGKMTLEKIILVGGTIRYGSSVNLFFKNGGGYLKAVYVKKGDMVEEGQTLAELDTADLENRLARKRLELARARLGYEQMKLEDELGFGGRKSDMKAALIGIDFINVEIDGIAKEIDEAKIHSPISGITEFVGDIKPGDYVKVYSTFIIISPTGSPVIETETINPAPQGLFAAYVSPSGIAAGTEASIEYTVYKDNESEKKMLAGTVQKVVGSAADAEIGKKEGDITKFPPLMAVIKPNVALPEDLEAGASVSVILDAGKLEDIIALPASAVMGFGDDKTVRLLKDGKVTVRSVTTGYEDDDADLVEITKGICEGETVIME